MTIFKGLDGSHCNSRNKVLQPYLYYKLSLLPQGLHTLGLGGLKEYSFISCLRHWCLPMLWRHGLVG